MDGAFATLATASTWTSRCASTTRTPAWGSSPVPSCRAVRASLSATSACARALRPRTELPWTATYGHQCVRRPPGTSSRCWSGLGHDGRHDFRGADPITLRRQREDLRDAKPGLRLLSPPTRISGCGRRTAPRAAHFRGRRVIVSRAAAGRIPADDGSARQRQGGDRLREACARTIEAVSGQPIRVEAHATLRSEPARRGRPLDLRRHHRPRILGCNVWNVDACGRHRRAADGVTVRARRDDVGAASDPRQGGGGSTRDAPTAWGRAASPSQPSRAGPGRPSCPAGPRSAAGPPCRGAQPLAATADHDALLTGALDEMVACTSSRSSRPSWGIISWTTTAIECGSSSRTPSSAASRTSSATRVSSGSSVSSPSGYSGGPSGRRATSRSASRPPGSRRPPSRGRPPRTPQRRHLRQALGDLLGPGPRRTS